MKQSLKYAINHHNPDKFMADPNKQIFQIYFAGASLAFGLPFLIIELISLVVSPEYYNEHSVFLGIVYITVQSLGGVIGGALVARRVERKDILRAGGVTGLMAFLLHQIIYFLFYGTVALGDTYTLFSLFGGSLVGSLIIRQRPQKIEEKTETKEEPTEEKKEEEEDLSS